MAVAQVHPLLRYIRKIAGSGLADGPTDGHLLDEYVACGNEAAFTALVKRHGAMVHGVCHRVLGNCHDADDAFQATFIVLMRNAQKVAKGESVGSWLHGVAYRIALKARAAALRRRDLETQAASVAVANSNTSALWQELGPILDQEIARLPEKYRKPFVLCYLEGKTNAEAAYQLGWPMGTVATRLARGRERLRKRLTRREVGLFAGLPAVLQSRTMFSAGASRRVEGALAESVLQLARDKAWIGVQISERATALAKGVERAMSISKANVVIVACILGALMAAGAGVVVYGVVDADPAKQRSNVASQTAMTPVSDGSQTESWPRSSAVIAEQDKPKQVRVIAEPDNPNQIRIECILLEVGPDGTEHVVSYPRISTAYGQAASLRVGQNFPLMGPTTVSAAGTPIQAACTYEVVGMQFSFKVTEQKDGNAFVDWSFEDTEIKTPKIQDREWNVIAGYKARSTMVVKLGEPVRIEFVRGGLEGQRCAFVFTICQLSTDAVGDMAPAREPKPMPLWPMSLAK